MDRHAIAQSSTCVPSSLWTHIKPRANITFVLAGDQPEADRIRIGGYVSSVDAASRPSITTTAGVVYLDEVEKIYKSSDQYNIEFYLITQSILTLGRRIEKLEKQIKTLINKLDSADE